MLESLNDNILRLRDIISEGVIVDDAKTCYVSQETVLEQGVRLQPNVTLLGKNIVGQNTLIGSGCVIENSIIGSDCRIRASYIEDAVIGDRVNIGPFAYLRNHCEIGDECRIGDFVEIKNAVLAKGVKSAHLAYIGDAQVGENTNVGCGSVFANYNGKIKQRSSVGKNVFIGCNTNLVAPVVVGDNAYIAAGSTVTSDVPSNNFCIARERQINKENWRK